MCVIVPKFALIGQSVVEMTIFRLLKMTGVWIFEITSFVTAERFVSVELRLSNCLTVTNFVAIDRISAIWDFTNFKFLTGEIVKKVKLLHRTKFRRNRSNRGPRYDDFSIFQSAILDLLLAQWDHPRSLSLCKIWLKSIQ